MIHPGMLPGIGGAAPAGWNDQMTDVHFTSVTGMSPAMKGKRQLCIQLVSHTVVQEVWVIDIANPCIISLDLLI